MSKVFALFLSRRAPPSSLMREKVEPVYLHIVRSFDLANAQRVKRGGRAWKDTVEVAFFRHQLRMIELRRTRRSRAALIWESKYGR